MAILPQVNKRGESSYGSLKEMSKKLQFWTDDSGEKEQEVTKHIFTPVTLELCSCNKPGHYYISQCFSVCGRCLPTAYKGLTKRDASAELHGTSTTHSRTKGDVDAAASVSFKQESPVKRWSVPLKTVLGKQHIWFSLLTQLKQRRWQQ